MSTPANSSSNNNGTRGRGRPKSVVTKRIERELTENGRTSFRYGDKENVTEINARMRLYVAARRLGIRIKTQKVRAGTTKEAVEATVVTDSAPQAVEAS